MMVSTKGRYALMVMIDLAQVAEKGNTGYVPLSEIAERQGLSMKYLEIVVAMLNRGGLLTSLRGKRGGYRLARDPQTYTIAEILQLTEGSLAPVDCLKQDEIVCDKAAGCMTLPLWVGLDRVIDRYLEQITLQDVLNGDREKMLQCAKYRTLTASAEKS